MSYLPLTLVSPIGTSMNWTYYRMTNRTHIWHLMSVTQFGSTRFSADHRTCSHYVDDITVYHAHLDLCAATNAPYVIVWVCWNCFNYHIKCEWSAYKANQVWRKQILTTLLTFNLWHLGIAHFHHLLISLIDQLSQYTLELRSRFKVLSPRYSRGKNQHLDFHRHHFAFRKTA